MNRLVCSFTHSLLMLIAMAWTSQLLAADADKPTAAAPTADGNACAWFNSIDDWRELDNRNLLVWVSKTEFYHVELSAPLIDLGSAESIAFVDHNGDGRVCGFGMDEVVVPRSSIFGSSSIISMTRLDEAGLASLADKYHLKLRTPKTKRNTQPVKAPTPEATK